MDNRVQIEKCLEIAEEFSFMPNTKNQIPHSVIIDSVTFFGGSFYPFHQGHRACLDLCPEKNIVVVLDRNPLKETRDFLPYDEYLKIKNELLGTPYYIYPGFWAHTEKNPTCNWLPHVKIPEKNLLIGDDSFMDFLSWKEPETILNALTKLYVVPRKYNNSDFLLQKDKILNLNNKIEIIRLDNHPFQDVSSTLLRE